MTIEKMKSVAKEYDDHAQKCREIAGHFNEGGNWSTAANIWMQAAIVLREAIIEELETGK